ncbi:putative mitochondrial ribosomal death-associated protein 3 [Lyophyllum shimeji]|uniref:Small ribosomal subunit protein mS29 n=1 Tax=Lyophyllum shimeji TaxID=47721 RepID=A0A9P3UT43_LYOSH|nr:putative mitochondrial ribosomal death-associated protein 3 [Lyophyllum shimeji]
MAKAAQPPPKRKSAGFSRTVKRDAQGQIIPEKKEKSLGAFRPLPAATLANPAFESDGRTVMKLPAFAPKPHLVGVATEFPTLENDPARIYGLPKKMLLEFRILSKPCSVVRNVTVKTAELLDKAKDKSSLETRVVLSGRAGCGKSFLMLQLVEHCILNDWIVIYIPRAVKLVDSTTPYEYDLRTRTYLQPAFAFQTLRRLLAANHAKLSALTTQKKHVFEKREVPLGTNLTDLIGVAMKEPPLAPLILDTVMAELSTQTKSPVLFAVDDFQALYCQSAYRDPHFVPIRPYHLAVPRLIMEYASGKKAFAKGAFVGAITASDTIYKLPLELKDALGLPHEHLPSPYDERSRPLTEYTTGLKPIHVPEQLSVNEAASLFEIWKEDKALTASMYDEVFLSKYTESSGNARDFVWKGLLATLES